jgi:hypothetical protein
MSVGLKAMPQSGLHNAITLFNLRNQTMYIGNQIFMNFSSVRSNNCTEQNSAKPRSWVDRQVKPAKRQPPCGSNWPGVPKLHFG